MLKTDLETGKRLKREESKFLAKGALDTTYSQTTSAKDGREESSKKTN